MAVEARHDTTTSEAEVPRASGRGARGSIPGYFNSYRHLVSFLDEHSLAWPSTEAIVNVLVANSAATISGPVLDHLKRRLDGTARKRRGRKKPTVVVSDYPFLVNRLAEEPDAWLPTNAIVEVLVANSVALIP